MAYTYGPEEGSNDEKVGIEVTRSPSTITSSTTSVTYTIKFKVYSQYDVNDDQVLNYNDSLSGTSSFHLSGAGDFVEYTKTYTINLSHSTTYSRTFSAVVSGHYGGATPGVSASVTVPRRPYAPALAPDTVVATRTSATNVTITWNRNATADAIVHNQGLQRSTDGVNWTTITTVTTDYTTDGTHSFNDTTTLVGTSYIYRVYADNDDQSATYSGGSAWTKILPAAPTGVTLSRATTTGTDGDTTVTSFTTTITRPVGYDSGTASWDSYKIERWDSIANAWSAVASDVSPATTTNQNSITNQERTYKYRVASVNVAGTSAWVESVAWYTRPAAPTGPVVATEIRAVKPDSNTVNLTWNETSTINTTVELYVRSSADKGQTWGAWTLVTSAASLTSYSYDPSNLGHWYQFRVRTGITGVSGQASLYSTYLTSQSVTFADVPSVAAAISLVMTRTLGVQAAEVSWTLPANYTNDEALWVSITIERRKNNGVWELVASPAIAASGVTTDNNLSYNSTYQYRIYGTNSIGQGAALSSTVGQTLSTCEAPNGFSVEKTAPTTAEVTWVLPASADDPLYLWNEYDIIRTDNLGVVVVTTLTDLVESWIDATLSEDHWYVYQMTVRNYAGSVETGVADPVYTIPLALSQLVAETGNSSSRFSSVRLTVDSPSVIATGTVIEYRVNAGPWSTLITLPESASQMFTQVGIVRSDKTIDYRAKNIVLDADFNMLSSAWTALQTIEITAPAEAGQTYLCIPPVRRNGPRESLKENIEEAESRYMLGKLEQMVSACEDSLASIDSRLTQSVLSILTNVNESRDNSIRMR